jgi:hypothetical protein
MLILTPNPGQPLSRRGAVLLVVITMLVLFAAVALAFVYYAQSEATASRYGRESQTAFRPDLDPELALSYFLSKLLYGDADDATGVYSALRGHDLSRLVYDWNDATFNTTPFNGMGRPHTDGNVYLYMNSYNVDDFLLPNYTWFQGDNLRDPGRKGFRASLSQARGPFVGGSNVTYTYPDLNNLCLAAVNAKGEVLLQSFYRPWAGPPGNTIGSLDPNNPNWGPNALTNNPWLKGATLRPLPAYHNIPGSKSGLPFQPPVSGGGDVKCLEGFLGVPVPGQPGVYYNEDSIWIDIGFPVLTAPDGTKYKPLFAAAIVDLDGKINLNACGNVRGVGQNNTFLHVSNQGWGVWETAIWRAMLTNNGQPAGNWSNLFLGNPPVVPGAAQPATPLILGRYGLDGYPSKANTIANSGEPPRLNAPVDYDATDAPNYAPSLKLLLAGDPNNQNDPNNNGKFVCFPYFPKTTYSNGDPYERTNHPLLFNPLTPGGDDRAFAAREMEVLLRFGGSSTPSLRSDLLGLCPLDFAVDRTRRLVTTHSFDLSKPGAIPWLSAPDPNYQMAAGAAYPTGQAMPYTTPATLPSGEFQTERSAATAILGRLNLNKSLSPYPLPNPATGLIDLTVPANVTQFQQAQADRQNMAQDLFNRLCWVTTGQQTLLPNGQPDPKFAAFLLTINPKLTPPGMATQYNAYRWLAQLAVNIVDYRDCDNAQPNANPAPPQYNLNYGTPFNWDPNYLQAAAQTADPTGGWVYGVELPQILINEAYAEIDNDPTDLPGNTQFQVKFWVELHNPLLPDKSLQDPLNADPAPNAGAYYSAARLTLPAALIANLPQYIPPYRIVIAQGPQGTWAAGSNLSDPGNARGDVPAANIKAVVQNWAPPATFVTAVDTTVVQAANGAYAGTNGTALTGGSNQGFYVVGPNEDFPYDKTINAAAPPANLPYATLRLAASPTTDAVTGGAVTNGMAYPWVVAANGVVPANGFYHTIVLQRLACPYLPFNNTPSVNGAPNPLYNPYITVDYLDAVPTYDGRTMVAGAANPAVVKDYTQRYAWGRKQPYAAFNDTPTYNPTWPTATPPTPYAPVMTDTQVLPQNPDSANAPPNITPYPGEPRHTFFRANGVGNTAPANPSPYPANTTGFNGETLTIPFDWLTHIDRQLVNPAELLTVSACRPSQLTQLFMSGGTPPNATKVFAHLAPWQLDQNSRLYRFLEFVKTDSRTPGIEGGGRLPGKINLNTIYDQEILDALCDPQSASYFPGANAQQFQLQLFQQFLRSRSPDLVTATSPHTLIPGATLTTGTNDRPFLPLSAGVVPTNPADPQWPTVNGGINDTILRVDPDDPTKPLFGVNAATQRNPYLQNELLQKILNNVTTRSNVYAVWVTVGFFEVTDPTARPVKLGAEIGKVENRNVRHRFFAILDRSNVAVPSLLTTVSQAVTGGPAPQPMTVGAAAGSIQAPPPVGVTLNWSFQPGMQVTVGAGTANQETVTITAPPVGTTITAVFNNNHAVGETVTVPGTSGPLPNTVLGNPGPQQRYDPRANSAVVLHFNIIE